ncbi:MAG: serine/threonine protein kinase [Planctomycetia bacterium]|nr:serine/threonine protein kinase [Planctomycetia bacterium]
MADQSDVRKSGEGGRPSAAELAAARRNPNLNLGRIVLLEELGRGGMGVVYRGWQDDLQRAVAVKVLAAHAPGNSGERFLREARLASRLRHPSIVTVHEMGEHQGRPWFSMDLVEGGSLDQLVRGRRLPARRLMEILAEVARALDYAHGQGVVHRDIKPGNILVTPGGKPFLTDFGLAGNLDGGARLTMTGVVMGTPAYMSPEQARGSRGKPDHRTDIYSLGAVMYEGLTGRTVVPKDDIVVMVNQVVEGRPDAPRALVPSVPQDAETVCLKCLQKEPARRSQTAGELADDIDRFLAGKPLRARGSTLLEKASRSAWARPPVLAGAAAALVAIALGAWALGRSRDRELEMAGKERALAEREEEVRKLQEALAKATDPAERRRLEEALAAKAGGAAAKDPTGTVPAGGATGKPPEPVKPPPPAPDRIPELERELAARLARGEFAAARAFADGAVPATDGERAWQDAARGRVLDAARRAFEDLDGRAAALLAAGRAEDAITLWKSVEAFGVEDLSRAAAARIGAAGPPPPDARAAALPRLGPLRDAVAAHAAARRYGEALRDIDALARAEPALAPDLAAVRSAVEGAMSLPRHAPAGAAALKGQPVPTKAGEGMIADAGETSFQVKVGPATLTLAYADLEAATLVRLAAAGGAPPEAIGAFWMFDGRPDLASKAWAGSPRAPELEALSAAFREATIEREARAALAELLGAAERKDWKKCRDLLAQRERLGGTAAWTAAASRIEDIAFDAAEKKGDEAFAVPLRKAGSDTEWRYDFADARQMLDWSQFGGDFYSAMGPAGLGWADGAATLTRAGMEFSAPIEGDQRVVIELTFTSFADQGSLHLHAGGYRFSTEPGGYVKLSRPDGSKLVDGTTTPFQTGRRIAFALVLGGGRVRATVDGKEVLSGETSPPLLPLPPRLHLIKSAVATIHRVTVTGRLPAGWAESDREQRALLARAARPSALGKPVVLTDGRSLGLFRTAEDGTWESKDGALRGQSPSDSVHAELHLNEPEHRNARIRLSYQVHSGRLVEVLVRAGDARVAYLLPTDRPGRWRDVEILLAESSARCLVDGVVSVAARRKLPLVGEGGMRILLMTTEASFRDVTVQEVTGLPAEPAWTVFFDEKPVAAIAAQGVDFDKRGGQFVGEGSVEFEPTQVPCEILYRMGDCGCRVRLEWRGTPLASFSTCSDSHDLLVRIRGDSADVLFDGVEIARGVRVPRSGKGPLRLSFEGGEGELHAILVRPLR